MIHPLSDCQCKSVPESTRVWQFCVILPNATIGEDSNICSHCLVENEAIIGNRCTIKCGVQLWDGIELEDDVFVGANVVFTNDKYPHSRNEQWTLLKTKVCRGATIGAGSTILPGLTIGEGAFIGAGSVVTHDVPAGETWIGNPARRIDVNKAVTNNISINPLGGGKILIINLLSSNINYRRVA